MNETSKPALCTCHGQRQLHTTEHKHAFMSNGQQSSATCAWRACPIVPPHPTPPHLALLSLCCRLGERCMVLRKVPQPSLRLCLLQPVLCRHPKRDIAASAVRAGDCNQQAAPLLQGKPCPRQARTPSRQLPPFQETILAAGNHYQQTAELSQLPSCIETVHMGHDATWWPLDLLIYLGIY